MKRAAATATFGMILRQAVTDRHAAAKRAAGSIRKVASEMVGGIGLAFDRQQLSNTVT
jgi:hypothetical protein